MNRNIAKMAAVSFLQGLVFYGPIATLYRLDRGISMSDIFLLQIVFSLVSTGLEIPWGWVADRIGYKKTLFISNALFLASKVAFFFAGGFFLFAMEAVLSAMAITGLSGCDSAFIYLSSGENDSGRNFGIYSAASTAGFVIASFAGGFMAAYSYSLNSFMTVVSYFAAMLLTCSLHDVRGGEGGKEPVKLSDMPAIFADRPTFVRVLAYCLVGQAGQALVFLNQPRFIGIGIDTQGIGMIAALTQMICLMSVKSYDIAKRMGETAFLTVTGAIVSAGFAVFAYSGSIPAVVLSYVFINASVAFQWPVLEVIKNRAVRIDNRATVLSVYSLLYSVVGIALNLTLSQLALLSPAYSFILLAVLASIGSVTYLAAGTGLSVSQE